MFPWSNLIRANDLIYGIFRVACGVLLTAMVVTVFAEVLARYVFLASTPWAHEVAVYCFIGIVLFGTSLGVRDHSHLVADVMPSSLPRTWDRLLTAFSHLAVTVMAIVFVWYGFDYAVLGLNRLSFSMGFPMTYIYISMPIAGAAILLFLIEKFHALWTERDGA